MWHCIVWYRKIFLIWRSRDQRGARLSGSTSNVLNSFLTGFFFFFFLVTVPVLEALILCSFALM
jgi:hypothetical protein